MIRLLILPVALVMLFSISAESAEKKKKPTMVIRYSDGKADGKKSIAGTGEMIEFSLPEKSQKLKGVQLHCSRYGFPKAPKENVEISILSLDESELVHKELVPYSKFKRGTARWTTIRFKKPATVPEKFWVIINFNAERTKGVYLSYDKSTEGKYSKTGLHGEESKEVTFEGDWMVQAMLTKPEKKK